MAQAAGGVMVEKKMFLAHYGPLDTNLRIDTNQVHPFRTTVDQLLVAVSE